MGRVAVVTGGASGIGLAVCRQLGARGHRVGVLDLDEQGAQRVASTLQSTGEEAIGCAVDVADRASVDDALAKVRADLGPVEIMVTSAGVCTFADVLDTTIEIWNRMLGVNLSGTFHCVQGAAPDMIAAGWGRIVTIASSAGQSGAPRLAAYAASKGGVIALTKALALEFGRHGITATPIPPVLTETPMAAAARVAGDRPDADAIIPMIPVGRSGTPDDIAAACAFLCSDEASYITGQVIAPNGGAII